MESGNHRDVVPLKLAASVWFSICLRTFGGPAGQIAVMHSELVERRRWIGEKRFLHALSFCTLLPGPEAQQLAIYLGWLLNGTLGGLIAGILFVAPGYLALMALAGVYARWGQTVAVAALFAGVAPAVLAIVAQALMRIYKRALTTTQLRYIAIAAFFALYAVNVPFPLVVGSAALIGWIQALRKPPEIPKASATAKANQLNAPLISDESLNQEPPTVRRAARILAVGLTLWFVPLIAAALVLGRSSVVSREGVFFSGTAMVTFGGAYAVLSFVAQRAVSQFHWLSAGEMVNGLALAETTPGPLIMVLEFVAFIGAYRHPGTLSPLLAGFIGATLTVWVTFVPCFIFVFLGAPYVERLRANLKLSGALTAITAAVVGVIANLSLFLSVHTLFRKVSSAHWWIFRPGLPTLSSVNWQALVVALLAFALVFKAKFSTPRVLIICGVTGSALFLLTR